MRAFACLGCRCASQCGDAELLARLLRKLLARFRPRAVNLQPLDRTHREHGPDLRERLLPGAGNSHDSRVLPRHPVGRETGDATGAQIAQGKRLDHRDERAVLGAPQKKERAGAALRVRPGLGADELAEFCADRVEIVLAVLEQRLVHVQRIATRFLAQRSFQRGDGFLQVHQPDDFRFGDPDGVGAHLKP